MSQPDREQFDDPKLRAAVGRVWGGERAPQALRERVAETLRAEAASAAGPASPAAGPMRLVPAAGPGSALARSRAAGWLRTASGVLAAAALVAVVTALTLRFVNGPRGASSPGAYATGGPGLPSLPASLADGLVRTHEFCSAGTRGGGRHHRTPDVDAADYAAIRSRLSGPLDGTPVLAAPVGAWKLSGAAVCRVNDRPVAHLMFVRNDRYISVFTLSRSACPTPDGPCDLVVERHPVHAIVRADGVYCVVGSQPDGSCTAEDVRAVRDELSRHLPVAVTPSPPLDAR